MPAVQRLRRSVRGMAGVTLALLPFMAAGVTASRADLARARALYNQRQFDDAIAAAAVARASAATADAAAVVQARAHLERYREHADPADLSAARTALAAARAEGLDARDRLEFLLAAGQSLFLEDDFGAAAVTFEHGLDGAAVADPVLHEAMLDWWGSASERHASTLPREARIAMFTRVADRLDAELSRNPLSPAASYWLVVALRGASEPRRAWDAAVAAWVRARLMGARAALLRADLDRFTLQAVIPDRARLPLEERLGTEAQMRAEWELLKEKWR